MEAYTPAEMARRVEAAGVAKAELDAGRTLVLGGLGGAFIALGGAFATLAGAGSALGWGPTRVLSGAVFSLGLILVVLAGAELFTGNNLVVMAWAERKVSTARLLRNWGLVYLGNLAGAVATAALVYLSRSWGGEGDLVGPAALKLAAAKASLAPLQAFVLGVLCNALVCLGVWLCFGARSNSDKILSIVPPVAAFVALGFEHSIANLYFFPLALWLKGTPAAAGLALDALTWESAARNVAAVTAGNIVGGAGLVAAVYWFVYLRKR